MNSSDVELNRQGQNSNRVPDKQHSQDDATTSTTSITSASSMTVRSTASTTIPTAKHQLAQELSAEGQQAVWPENTGTLVKRPRLDLADCEVASTPQVSSPTSVMSSSHRNRVGLHPPNQLDEVRNASTYPSLPVSQDSVLMMCSPYFSRPPQQMPFYQPFSPNPVASQTGGDFDNYMYSPRSICDTPYFPPESMFPYQASQQMRSTADPETQRHKPQPSTPQGTFYNSSRAQTTGSAPETEVVRQSPAPAANIEKQTRQFSSRTRNASLSLKKTFPGKSDIFLQLMRRPNKEIIMAISCGGSKIFDGPFGFRSWSPWDRRFPPQCTVRFSTSCAPATHASSLHG